jgi:hypothetical protein
MFEDQEHHQPDAPDMLSPLDKVPHEGAPEVPRTASALESGLIRPVQLPGQQQAQTPVPGAAPLDRTHVGSTDLSMELPEISAPFMSRWKIMLLVIFVVALVAGGIYMFYRKITAENRVIAPAPQQPAQEQPKSGTPTAETPKPSTDVVDDSDNIVPPPPTVLPEAPKDTDQDGLTDVEEAELGTDPLSPDTDKDGLTDKEEVLLWRTNPKNPDSDGDTFLDGEEVSHGYRPDGPGKLFE